MYTPNHFIIKDEDEAVGFMQRYSFATIVSTTNNRLEATHLPFVIEKLEGKIYLLSHFAKANTQTDMIMEQEVLVIFSEPHAYISPTHYDKQANVPTWNYIAVHAYGKVKILPDVTEKLKLLHRTVNTYEPAYMQQWDSLPETYRLGLLNGITAFEIEVTELQGKKKISQNKTYTERERIITSLSQSKNSNERDIANYMMKWNDKADNK